MQFLSGIPNFENLAAPQNIGFSSWIPCFGGRRMPGRHEEPPQTPAALKSDNEDGEILSTTGENQNNTGGSFLENGGNGLPPA